MPIKSNFSLPRVLWGGVNAAFLLSAYPALADDTAATPNNGAEIQAKANYSGTPSTNIQGGTGYGAETTVYSSTFDTNWRLFAGEEYSHEEEPLGEGNVTLWRSKAGAEYHDNAVKLDLAPTFNYYGNDDRFGGIADASWTLNDHWVLGGSGQIFSEDTPLRALNADVTANSYNANVEWHQPDVRSVRVNANMMTFSDDNVRGGVSGVYTERLHTDPKFIVDGLVTAAGSQDSLDENRLYYNPKTDLLGSAGLQITQVLYRDGDTVYQHSLQLLPGDYWQKNYGQSLALSARYELRTQFYNGFEIGLGAGFSRQSANGTEENTVTGLLDLTRHFK